jgi:hypothetical protein
MDVATRPGQVGRRAGHPDEDGRPYELSGEAGWLARARHLDR